MDARKLILAWTFYKDVGEWDNEPELHRKMKVQDSNRDSLCAVIMGDKSKQKQILKILEFMAGEAGKFEGTHLILLHETHRGVEAETIQKLLGSQIDDCLKDCRYEFFGGSNGIIYEILLDDTAMFMKEAFHEQNVIKADVFDAIWDEYVKKKLVRLKYDILSDFCSIVISMRGLKEYAEKKGDAEKYLGEIKKEDWALFSEDSLNKYDWPSDVKIKEAIRQKIDSLGEIVEESKVPQDVIDEMKNKELDIDDWYSNLGQIFERYT